MTSIAKFQVKEYGSQHQKVLFMLGGWKTKQFLYALPAKILARKGYRCIVYTYEPSIFSPDVTRTRESLHAVKDDILQRIEALKAKGIKDFSLYGFSLGSVIGCMAANNEPLITKIVLNTVGTSMAAAVWTWDNRAPGFKQSLVDQGYDLEKLEDAWRTVAPAHNIGNFHAKRVLMYLAAHDVVIPFAQGKQLAAMMRNQEAPLELHINKYGGHAIAGVFNIYRMKKYLRFFESS